MHRRLLPWVWFAALAGALASTSSSPAAQTPLTATLVASGLQRPVWVGAPPGDRRRLFVIESWRGRVRIVKDGALLERPFLDIGGAVATQSEQGLLGLAFHPDYAANSYFYVSYTRAQDGAKVVARYTASAADPDVANPGSALTILGPIAQPQPYHNAGCLQFGRDGFLYIALGDGGAPSCTAQGPGLLGKMLRIDVDGGVPYAIPPTNPFAGIAGVRGEIWSIGWRNPWRFSFDRVTGDMYVGDVGLNKREEISFQPGSSPGGDNYGWDVMEGSVCFNTCVVPCHDQRLRLPIYEYVYGSGGDRCVIGGHVYRGYAIPDLDGHYFFADFSGGSVWSLRYSQGQVQQLTERTAELFASGAPAVAPTSFGEDADGELYFTTLGGALYRIDPRTPSPATNLGFGKVGGNGLAPHLSLLGQLSAGSSGELLLRRAPPAAAAALLVSTQASPTALPFGTVVPVPPQLMVARVTSGTGELALSVPGGLGPAVLYAQYLVLDPGASGGIGVSNALRLAFP